jgi:PIN domain nuclease of toxin-antitoxin system
VRLLLDTHTLLWALTAPEDLGPAARPAIEAPENDVFASAVSAWEIAIKQQLGKLTLPAPAQTWLMPAVEATGLRWLDVTPTHALRVGAVARHHQDPFDRLLVAQAMDGYVLATRDPEIAKCAVSTVW